MNGKNYTCRNKLIKIIFLSLFYAGFSACKQEENESGPLIDFINVIAEEIEKDYQDILINTNAYNKNSIKELLS